MVPRRSFTLLAPREEKSTEKEREERMPDIDLEKRQIPSAIVSMDDGVPRGIKSRTCGAAHS